ncbi:hypothetical protein LXL04_031724 [Taraxacum kok-saghyz]
MDGEGEDKSVESPLLLKPTTFHVGEIVFAYFIRGHLHEAKVLNVDTKAKRLFIHYKGKDEKFDQWVGVERIMKYNQANQKAPKKHHLLIKIKELKPKYPNGWAENKFVPSVVRAPLTVVGNPGVKLGLNPQPVQQATPRIEQLIPCDMKKLKGPKDEPLGPTSPPLNHSPLTPVTEPLTKNNANLMTHVLPPKTNTSVFSDMSEEDFWKNHESMGIKNFIHTAEVKSRYNILKGKESELKEELTRCKATMVSQVEKIGVLSEEVVGVRKELDEVRGKVVEMQAERTDVINGAIRAEAARAQAEAGRLELLGRVSKCEGEIAELLKKKVEVDP